MAEGKGELRAPLPSSILLRIIFFLLFSVKASKFCSSQIFQRIFMLVPFDKLARRIQANPRDGCSSEVELNAESAPTRAYRNRQQAS